MFTLRGKSLIFINFDWTIIFKTSFEKHESTLEYWFASCRKAKALVLVPRKNPLKNWLPPENVQVIYGTNGCFNEAVVSQHYIPLLVDYKVEHNLPNLDFIFDQAPCHMTRQVTNTFQAASIKVQPVPKCMTPMFQPADVAWMRPLKVAYFKKWNE